MSAAEAACAVQGERATTAAHVLPVLLLLLLLLWCCYGCWCWQSSTLCLTNYGLKLRLFTHMHDIAASTALEALKLHCTAAPVVTRSAPSTASQQALLQQEQPRKQQQKQQQTTLQIQLPTQSRRQAKLRGSWQ
jgi:hypothetical protein